MKVSSVHPAKQIDDVPTASSMEGGETAGSTFALLLGFDAVSAPRQGGDLSSAGKDSGDQAQEQEFPEAPGTIGAFWGVSGSGAAVNLSTVSSRAAVSSAKNLVAEQASGKAEIDTEARIVGTGESKSGTSSRMRTSAQHAGGAAQGDSRTTGPPAQTVPVLLQSSPMSFLPVQSAKAAPSSAAEARLSGEDYQLRTGAQRDGGLQAVRPSLLDRATSAGAIDLGRTNPTGTEALIEKSAVRAEVPERNVETQTPSAAESEVSRTSERTDTARLATPITGASGRHAPGAPIAATAAQFGTTPQPAPGPGMDGIPQKADVTNPVAAKSDTYSAFGRSAEMDGVTSTGTAADGTPALAQAASGDAAEQGGDDNPSSGLTPSLASIVDAVVPASSGNAQAHRESSGADGDSRNRGPAPQDPAGIKGSLNPPNTLSSLQGLSAQGSSTRGQERLPNTPQVSPQTLMLLDHMAASGAARALGNALRSDVHIGLQTEGFGRVTIQASTEGGQLSAQLSVENTHQSGALAAHLPALEQRLSEVSRLEASMRIVTANGSSFGGAGTGGDGGSRSYQGSTGNGRGPTRVSLRTTHRSDEIRDLAAPAASGPRTMNGPGPRSLDITV